MRQTTQDKAKQYAAQRGTDEFVSEADSNLFAITPEETTGELILAIKGTQLMHPVSMGLDVQGLVGESEWEEMGNQLFAVEDKLAYRWGDWLNAGNFEWGAYKRFSENSSKSWRTIEDYAYICRNVHLSCRHESLSLSHHKAVAPLYDADDKERTRNMQRMLLEYAAENNLGKDDFREIVSRVTDGAPEMVSPALPETIINAADTIIVIKPPFWQRPIERLEKDFIKRWKEAAQDERQAALKRLKALVKELEKME